jgi:hypothetical protein
MGTVASEQETVVYSPEPETDGSVSQFFPLLAGNSKAGWSEAAPIYCDPLLRAGACWAPVVERRESRSLENQTSNGR